MLHKLRKENYLISAFYNKSTGCILNMLNGPVHFHKKYKLSSISQFCIALCIFHMPLYGLLWKMTHSNVCGAGLEKIYIYLKQMQTENFINWWISAHILDVHGRYWLDSKKMKFGSGCANFFRHICVFPTYMEEKRDFLEYRCWLNNEDHSIAVSLLGGLC